MLYKFYLQLLPECAPHSVSYILELLATRNCAGCHFYRAESRGSAWDLEGNHIHDVRNAFDLPFSERLLPTKVSNLT